MDYKIVYLEDLVPDSIIEEIEEQGLKVEHVKPLDNFEDTLIQIKNIGADLILMDFRLYAGVSKFNAPPFAQFFRSQVVEKGESLPIALISSETEIHSYYRDYTSFDLFDFAVEKGIFIEKIKKYSNLMKELIDSYKDLKTKKYSEDALIKDLLDVPEELQLRLDRRLLELLVMDKYQNDAFMMSGLLLSSLVKPIGILIGPDVLAARLGVDVDSQDWDKLLKEIDEFKYTGLYSKTYERWWAQGIDIWWSKNFPTETSLRRLTADERHKVISERFNLNLNSIDQPKFASSSRYWTICSGNFKQPLDPIDGFEIIKDTDVSPWLENKYYSFEYLIDNVDQKILKKIKEQDRNRLSQKMRGK